MGTNDDRTREYQDLIEQIRYHIDRYYNQDAP